MPTSELRAMERDADPNFIGIYSLSPWVSSDRDTPCLVISSDKLENDDAQQESVKITSPGVQGARHNELF